MKKFINMFLDPGINSSGVSESEEVKTPAELPTETNEAVTEGTE